LVTSSHSLGLALTAANKGTRISVGGFIFFNNKGPITWQANNQSVVALSTLEAEYIACSDSTREATWLRRLYTDIKRLITEMIATTIKCDNQGALKLIKSGIVKAKTKHIDVKYHHSHDEQNRGTVDFIYVTSNENVADVLTKALSPSKHQGLIQMLSLKTC